MARSGPKPLPTSVKKIKGTAKPSRLLKNEYAPNTAEKLPPPPKYFNAFSKKEYAKVGKQLLADGLLANIDMTIFIAYCHEMGIYYDAQVTLAEDGRVIKLKGSGYMQPHPLVAISNKALANAQKIAVEFGITPSARTRVSAPKKVNTNPILKLIAQNGKKGNEKTA